MSKTNQPLTLFSWGYHGWGSSTRQFVQSADAIEAERGYQPPIFVDTRISRSVRAVGFREKAFENLAGPDRYVWMKDLGNERIKTRSGRGIKIAKPKAANDLLDLAIEAAHDNRRILFFCGCREPRCGRQITCHRTVVGELVLKAAFDRGLHANVVEWPGDEPKYVTIELDEKAIRRIVDGSQQVALSARQGKSYRALPWGSVVELKHGEDTIWVISGPAQFSGGSWHLPVVWFLGSDEISRPHTMRKGEHARWFLGYDRWDELRERPPIPKPTVYPKLKINADDTAAQMLKTLSLVLKDAAYVPAAKRLRNFIYTKVSDDGTQKQRQLVEKIYEQIGYPCAMSSESSRRRRD